MCLHPTHRCKSTQRGRACEDKIITLFYSAQVLPGEIRNNSQSFTSPALNKAHTLQQRVLFLPSGLQKQKTLMNHRAFKRLSWMVKKSNGIEVSNAETSVIV